MACPHGNGASAACSQCLGATPRAVSIVGRDLVVDGTVVSSTAAHSVIAEEAMFASGTRRRGAHQGAKAQRKCERCGLPNHNVRTCTMQRHSEDEGPELAEIDELVGDP